MKLLVALFALLILSAPALACEAHHADASAALTFHGFACTDDCSGHRAGFDWAAENEITDESGCGGNSQSFTEGCIAYVRSLAADGAEGESDEEYYADPASTQEDPISP